jgi:hypothetical protein
MNLFACSGPGAGETIARNIAIGYTHAAIVGGMLVASIVLFAIGPRRWIFPVVILGLVALHPAWTISAIQGDCGILKRDASSVFTGIATLAIIVQGVVFALDNRGTGSAVQYAFGAQDATKSNITDGAIREGEPPINPRSKDGPTDAHGIHIKLCGKSHAR